MTLHVACVQMEPKLGDRAANLAKMSAFFREAMRKHPETELLVFPELITTGYECGGDFYDLAEPLQGGESAETMGALAREYGVSVIYGFPERDAAAPDVLYNSAAFLDGRGKALGAYRKVHLFADEKKFFRPGCAFPVFKTELGKIGILICWDTAFPEAARALALQGAQLLAVSTNWEKPYAADWDLVTRARAFDNTCYLAAANRIGFDKTLGFFGRSKIIGPLGVPLRELNEETEGILAAPLDLSLPHRLRREYYTFFRDRRPDAYSIPAGPY